MRIHKNTRGFTLVEIMIVVAIIGLLAAIAVPNFVQARSTAKKNTCINNLRLIDAATEQWAMDNNKDTGDTVTTSGTPSILDYLKGAQLPVEPSGGAYTITNVGAAPSCSVSGHTLVVASGS